MGWFVWDKWVQSDVSELACLLLSAAPNQPLLVLPGRLSFGFKPALFSPDHPRCSELPHSEKSLCLCRVGVFWSPVCPSGCPCRFTQCRGLQEAVLGHCQLPGLPQVCHQLSAEVEGGILLSCSLKFRWHCRLRRGIQVQVLTWQLVGH